ncbi:MAG: hypothetical protein H6719_03585 [Sandaracinaceae bacterium]|nr:hypothetical protein [Sandaracinaceae bacterium]
MRIASIVGLTLLGALAGMPRQASAQGDYATSGDAWNSVSELMRLAGERGSTPEIPDRLDVGTLQPSDSLLILNPQDELPSAALTAFLRDGGRACLADDFGAGESFLSLFSIHRSEPSDTISVQLRGNASLPVARPNGTHQLTHEVSALVTNHPAVVSHRELAAIFQLGSGEAVVLAGAVGEGRLVVLSDPSVLIDNMLSLRGNRRFAENLVDYLAGDRAGRLIVVRPGVPIVGRYGEPGADRPLHDLRASLERVAHLDVPPLALRIASLALAAIAVILALGALPRRSPYRSARMFAREAAQGGFVGRVGFFARPRTNLLQPLMVYKFELEAEILGMLALSGRTLLRDVLGAMRARGMNEQDLDDMRRLLLTLDRLHADQDRPAAPPTVSPRRFRELVQLGDGLLEKLSR